MSDITKPKQFDGTNRRRREKYKRKAMEIDHARKQVDLMMTPLIPPFHACKAEKEKVGR